jgi:hypothetical protein
MNRLLPAALLFAIALAVLALGLRTHWFPHQVGDPIAVMSQHPLPGETWGGLVSGERFTRDGLRYLLLERIGNMTYTHHINIDATLQYLLLLTGANSHIPLAIANAIAFLAGLWLGYLTVLRASGDKRIALAFLFFFGTTYYFNLLFALNMRAWHWPGLFGVLLCTLLMCGTEQERQRGQWWIFPAALVAFACSYDFAAEVAFAAFAVAALYRKPRAAAFVVGAFAAAFTLRQLQVIGAIGLRDWATDLWYTAAIKSGLIARFLQVDLATVDAWYAEHGIQRYPSIPAAMSVREYGRIVQATFLTSWVPWLGASIAGLGGYLCVRSPAWRFLIAITAGMAVGLAVFAPYSLVWAFTMLVPLVLAPIDLATAVLCVELTRYRFGFIFACGLVGVHLAVQLENWLDFPLASAPFPLLPLLFR